MAYTKIEKKSLADLPAGELKRALRIKRMEKRLWKKRNEGVTVGLTKAYGRFIDEWYRMFDRINGGRS